MQTHTNGKASGKSFVILLILLLTVLCVLFRNSFDPNQILFANDMPLGALKAEQSRLPGTFTGNWQPSNWIGNESVSSAPNITALLGTIFPPEILMKLYAPFTMLLFGLSAWLLFRELGFRRIVCILGGLAAGLNMHAFSIACWGLGHWVISFAMVFLAIAALVSKSISRGWIRGVLAGAAVGIGLMEGFDVGAINSLYVGVFGLFAGMVGEKLSGRSFLKSALVVAVVAIFAALTAAHTISSLVGTQVKGVKVAAQDDKTKEERWIWATQWSLPKLEVLRVLVPGIFGYRMVDGDNQPYKKSYWGAIAQTPGYEDPGPNYHLGLARHSGSGEYSGIFVLLVAIFAVAQSFRKQNSPFTAIEKKFVWFWAGAALVSLLLALGRHAPFYQIVFALPYFSTIRNPIKFLHPFHIALLILFGYGLESMVRRYFDSVKTNVGANGSNRFEKKWILFSCLALGVSVLGWMIYSGSEKVLAFLGTHFPRDLASQIFQFSVGEVGWFVFFFAASVVLVVLILRGKFIGKMKLAGVLMGALIIADLSHADVHWIVYQNFKEKYQSNPILEMLAEKPYEHRVAIFPFGVNEAMSFLQGNVYYLEWLQHHFLYYNIQSFDVPQEPRIAADKETYLAALRKPTGAAYSPEDRMTERLRAEMRLWELSNVRYIFGLTGEFIDSLLNQRIDPEKKRFKIHTQFNIAQGFGDNPYLVQTNSTGPFALIEFTGALPRAKLYNNWQVITNDQATLEKLTDPSFDPTATVLIANEISAPASAGTNSSSGTVQIVTYQPKRVELNAKVSAPSVLLLNDRFNPQWRVFVDGQEKPLLRANFIMRGVQLEPGEHKIEFRFEPPLTTLYISLAALGVGLVVCAFVAFRRKKGDAVS